MKQSRTLNCKPNRGICLSFCFFIKEIIELQRRSFHFLRFFFVLSGFFFFCLRSRFNFSLKEEAFAASKTLCLWIFLLFLLSEVFVSCSFICNLF